MNKKDVFGISNLLKKSDFCSNTGANSAAESSGPVGPGAEKPDNFPDINTDIER